MSDFEASIPEADISVRPITQSRMPLQERSQQRMASALVAAISMLERLGPEETSISEIAKEAGISRVSLYQFFPNKYVLFTHLSEQYLGQLKELLTNTAPLIAHCTWREGVIAVMRIATEFYNKTPAASILLLGGATSRSAYLAQKAALDEVCHEVRQVFAHTNPPLFQPTNEPDVAALAIEIGFACLKHGYYRENFISPEIEAQAVCAVTGYLLSWSLATTQG